MVVQLAGRRSSDGPRTRWWTVAAVAGVLLVAAVAVSSQLGTNGTAGDADSAAEVPETSTDVVALEEDAAPVTTAATAEAPAESEPSASGEEPAEADDESGLELSEAFGEPEHPVSGVEPYVPRRVRSTELGPPAEVCLGTLPAYRIQLPLRFASSNSESIEQLTWSPDCRHMVFRVGATLWLADGDGTGDMPFLTAQHGLSAPAWSPDGEWVAFSQGAIVDGERASHIFIVMPDALGLAQVTEGAVLDQNPAWSRDGERIVFSRRVRAADGEGASEFDQLIVEVDIATGEEWVLVADVEPDASPSWSPDGELLTYGSGVTLMASRRGEDSGRVLLEDASGRGASWSPDGSRIAALQLWYGGRPTIVISDLSAQHPENQHVIALRGFLQISRDIAPTLQWSADGQRLFFFHSDSPTSHWAYSIVVPQANPS